MALRIEPPRGRLVPAEASRYPGLTPEERGYDDAPPRPVVREAEPGPPLWILPSELPPASRPTGFVGPLPREALPPEYPPPPPPEGLFDVPGLLERLWLARALEVSHQERARPPLTPRAVPPPVLPYASVLPLAVTRSGAARPMAPPAPVGGRAIPSTPPAPSARPAVPPPAPILAPPVPSTARPKSWICPYCYLTNDAAWTTCRGCRSGALHL